MHCVSEHPPPLQAIRHMAGKHHVSGEQVMHQSDFSETLIFRASPLKGVNQANGQLT